MSTIFPYLYVPIFSWPTNPGGLLYTYAAGGTTPQATYSDDLGNTSNSNPVVLDSTGSATVRLDPTLSYHFVLKDPTGVTTVWDADNYSGFALSITSIGAILYPQTPAELAASVTPVNYAYAPGVIDRYGTNTTPGTTDMLTAINNAILQSSETGGAAAVGMEGTYFHSAALTMMANVKFSGQGKYATTFLSSHTGNGIVTTSTINTATGVFTEIRDCRFKNTNASNTGGGLVDIAGTEVIWRAVRVEGFAYGGILDQSELADVDLCDFENFLTGGVWLTNGADHTVGASAGFTNRISINRSQFNGAAGAGSTAQGIAIVDDGGAAHMFRDNNFNLCVNHFRIASLKTGEINGSELETASGPNILFVTTTSILGTSVGGSGIVIIRDNFISPSSTSSYQTATIATSALGSLIVIGNRLITSAATFINTSNCNSVFAFGNYDSNVGTIFDGTAGIHFESAVAKSTTLVKNTNLALTGNIGFNGNSPVAQNTGWGTPTGPTTVSNFPGASATLAQTSGVVAEIITFLKSRGDFGA